MVVSEAKLRANRLNAQSPDIGRPKGSIGEALQYAQAFKIYLAKQIEKHKGGMIDAMIKQALDGNVEAFKALLDRAQGKPAQAVEVSGQNGNPIVFMPLELIQKHSLKVIEGQQVEQNVKELPNKDIIKDVQ